MARKLSKIAKMVAAGNENSVENMFTNDIKQVIENTQSPYTPSTYYKPSGVGGCIRKMYFERIGKPLQDDAGMNLIGMGETGTFRHEVIQEYLLKLSTKSKDFTWIDVAENLEKFPVEGTWVDDKFKKNDYETKCKNDLLQLSFLCDGLIEYKGKRYILEIKTETMFKYTKHDGPYEEHKMQAACYGMSLGIDDVMFLYENRDSFDKKAYTYHITQEMKDRVVNKIARCEAYVEAGESPKEYCTSNYCPYCKKEGKKM